MNWEVIAWCLVALSLIGNVFVVKKNVLGQWLWVISNIGWVTYNITIGANAQAFLFAVYMGLCVWGIIAWTKTAKEAAANA